MAMKKQNGIALPVPENLYNKQAVCDYLQSGLDAYQYQSNKQLLCVAAKEVIHAYGGITHMASRAQISRAHLSYVLSGRCNPRFSTVMGLVKVLDCHLQICVRE